MVGIWKPWHNANGRELFRNTDNPGQCSPFQTAVPDALTAKKHKNKQLQLQGDKKTRSNAEERVLVEPTESERSRKWPRGPGNGREVPEMAERSRKRPRGPGYGREVPEMAERSRKWPRGPGNGREVPERAVTRTIQHGTLTTNTPAPTPTTSRSVGGVSGFSVLVFFWGGGGKGGGVTVYTLNVKNNGERKNQTKSSKLSVKLRGYVVVDTARNLSSNHTEHEGSAQSVQFSTVTTVSSISSKSSFVSTDHEPTLSRNKGDNNTNNDNNNNNNNNNNSNNNTHAINIYSFFPLQKIQYKKTKI